MIRLRALPRLALSAAVIALALPAAGLEGQGPRQRQGAPGPVLAGSAALALEHATELELSDLQRDSLSVIRAESDEALAPIREDGARLRRRARDADRGSMRTEMRAFRERVAEALRPFEERTRAVLSDEQMERLEALRPSGRGRRGGG